MITFPIQKEAQAVMAARANKKPRKKTFSEIQVFNIEKDKEFTLKSIKPASSKGRLSLVTTPIGEYHDITYRALRTIRESEFLLCEDLKESSKLLRFFGIQKEMHLLNEHNEKDSVQEYINILLSGKNVTLISDCGTPAFADPGLSLVNSCIQNNIEIDFIHGANSVISAVTISGFDISRFYFYGFLSPKNEIRLKELKKISALPYPVILMDTPYRLSNLIKDMTAVLPDRNIFLALNLSSKDEKQMRGKPEEILKQLSDHFGESKPKAEFIIVLDKFRK